MHSASVILARTAIDTFPSLFPPPLFDVRPSIHSVLPSSSTPHVSVSEPLMAKGVVIIIVVCGHPFSTAPAPICGLADGCVGPFMCRSKRKSKRTEREREQRDVMRGGGRERRSAGARASTQTRAIARLKPCSESEAPEPRKIVVGSLTCIPMQPWPWPCSFRDRWLACLLARSPFQRYPPTLSRVVGLQQQYIAAKSWKWIMKDKKTPQTRFGFVPSRSAV